MQAHAKDFLYCVSTMIMTLHSRCFYSQVKDDFIGFAYVAEFNPYTMYRILTPYRNVTDRVFFFFFLIVLVINTLHHRNNFYLFYTNGETGAQRIEVAGSISHY